MITAHPASGGGAAAVKAALLTSQDLRATERLVLVAIAAHTNRHGDAWPSVATIAQYAGVSTRTVQRTLAKLVQLGRLAVRQVAAVATRVYRLTIRQSSPTGGDNPHPGVTNGRPGGDTHSVSPEAEEDHTKPRPRPGAPNWRRFLPRNRPARQEQPANPWRRGAALPVADKADQCPRHRGSLATHCGPCRSERLAGDTP